MTVVIVRKDLAERADKNLPTILQYRTHIKEKSLYHTPPTFAVYIVGLVTGMDRGGRRLAAIRETQRGEGQAALRSNRCERRILRGADGEGLAIEDECDVSCGGWERGT